MKKFYLIVENGKTPEEGVWFDGHMGHYEDAYGGLDPEASDTDKEAFIFETAKENDSYVVIYFKEDTTSEDGAETTACAMFFDANGSSEGI